MGEDSTCQYSITPSLHLLLERVLLRGKLSLFHLADEIFYRAVHHFFQIGILFDELRREIVEQAEHVMHHQHLAIAVSAGADADGRNRQALGDFLGQVQRACPPRPRKKRRLPRPPAHRAEPFRGALSPCLEPCSRRS